VLGLVFLTGIVQDTVRKLTPGQPVWIQLTFLIPALLGLIAVAGFSGWKFLSRRRPALLCLISGLGLLTWASFVRLYHMPSGEGFRLALLGWIVPVGVVAGSVWGSVCQDRCSSESLRQLVAALLVLVGLYFCGSFLELLMRDDHPWMGLGPLAPKRPWYRTIGAERFRMLCGFFRSPETAGWFSAAILPLCCFYAAEHWQPNTSSERRIRIAVITAGVIAGMVCILAGRRKMQVMLLLLTAIVALFLHLSKRQSEAGRFARTAGGVAVISILLMSLLPNAGLYLGYFSSSPSAVPERTFVSTWTPILSYSPMISWFGVGLGEMVPGRQYIGGRSLFFTEGGLVRVFVESGWMGLTLFLATIGAFLYVCSVQFRSRCDFHASDKANNSAAIFATSFLFSCFFSFLIGHQTFGDPFVGFLIGIAIAVASPAQDKTVAQNPLIRPSGSVGHVRADAEQTVSPDFGGEGTGVRTFIDCKPGNELKRTGHRIRIGVADAF